MAAAGATLDLRICRRRRASSSVSSSLAKQNLTNRVLTRSDALGPKKGLTAERQFPAHLLSLGKMSSQMARSTSRACPKPRPKLRDRRHRYNVGEEKEASLGPHRLDASAFKGVDHDLAAASEVLSKPCI
eukprot:CAMPEP_0206478562 /NCGR_PEP_ID=MMETSP0324_2-20121206/36126_1 /ASSEMBLY_ACC=CAM_ASM_000836 /TAXON_ID=2866 /ORGANISM="Crypthecodinium cohnii, Strain Seligo" /LENGTH=129 /DNA_ID=CAMNT_0053954889 /DNA_START=674 /DNA_END=1061 /DNA_ORIENTATION=+